MDNRNIKLDARRIENGQKPDSLHDIGKNGKESENIPHGEETKKMVEQVTEMAEQGEESAGFDEKQASYKGTGGGKALTSSASQVFVQPPISEMIRQTVEAIEMEMAKNEKEMKAMMKNKAFSYYQINDKARQIRFLNGLLSELRRAARLAEDFIVSMWKQYVKKA